MSISNAIEQVFNRRRETNQKFEDSPFARNFLESLKKADDSKEIKVYDYLKLVDNWDWDEFFPLAQEHLKTSGKDIVIERTAEDSKDKLSIKLSTNTVEIVIDQASASSEVTRHWWTVHTDDRLNAAGTYTLELASKPDPRQEFSRKIRLEVESANIHDISDENDPSLKAVLLLAVKTPSTENFTALTKWLNDGFEHGPNRYCLETQLPELLYSTPDNRLVYAGNIAGVQKTKDGWMVAIDTGHQNLQLVPMADFKNPNEQSLVLYGMDEIHEDVIGDRDRVPALIPDIPKLETNHLYSLAAIINSGLPLTEQSYDINYLRDRLGSISAGESQTLTATENPSQNALKITKQDEGLLFSYLDASGNNHDIPIKVSFERDTVFDWYTTAVDVNPGRQSRDLTTANIDTLFNQLGLMGLNPTEQKQLLAQIASGTVHKSVEIRPIRQEIPVCRNCGSAKILGQIGTLIIPDHGNCSHCGAPD